MRVIRLADYLDVNSIARLQLVGRRVIVEDDHLPQIPIQDREIFDVSAVFKFGRLAIQAKENDVVFVKCLDDRISDAADVARKNDKLVVSAQVFQELFDPRTLGVSPAVLPVPCRGTQSTLKVNDLCNTQRYFFSDGGVF